MTEAKYSGANNSSQVYFSAMAFSSATYKHDCPMIQVRIIYINSRQHTLALSSTQTQAHAMAI